MSLAPGVRLGRYEIRSQIGSGGMGEVYLAWDSDLDRTVALKILPTAIASDPERMRRFVQEAKAASALNHPNILIVHDVGRSDSIPYMVTEHVQGTRFARASAKDRCHWPKRSMWQSRLPRLSRKRITPASFTATSNQRT